MLLAIPTWGWIVIILLVIIIVALLVPRFRA